MGSSSWWSRPDHWRAGRRQLSPQPRRGTPFRRQRPKGPPFPAQAARDREGIAQCVFSEDRDSEAFLIAKETRPEYVLAVRGRVGALIELGTGFNPILSGRENIYNYGAVLGLPKREIDARLCRAPRLAAAGRAPRNFQLCLYDVAGLGGYQLFVQLLDPEFCSS